jgi:hypothetical membrane protein
VEYYSGLAVKALKALVVLSVAIPLVAIVVSASSSGWFNLVENALSDLGHATRSRVAPVFNAGLALGGLSAYTVAVTSRGVKKRYKLALVFSAIMLIFIGVFDEVYGNLHFYVSVLFFLGLLVYTGLCAVDRDFSAATRSLASVAVVLMAVAWTLHFAFKTPPGAAIPELISVFAWLPLYFKVFYK